MKPVIFSLFAVLLAVACQPKAEPDQADPTATLSITELEAREDSLELIATYAAQEKIALAVPTHSETSPINAQNIDDAADDPAIWVNPKDPGASLIYGSNKKGGLAVYNLAGQEVAYYPIGNINNVDILYDLPTTDQPVTLVGCSNRSDQSIDILAINPADGTLTDIASGTLAVDSTLIDDIYGFCFATTTAGDAYAIINGKNGLMQQFALQLTEEGTIDLLLARSVQFDSQTEGMVADHELGHLYVGEEGRGIWKLDIDPDSTTKTLLPMSGADNPNIAYDVEGITLYKTGTTSGYLLASSQGNFSYAVFDRETNAYLTSFKIVSNGSLDGVEETDGLDVVADSLSPAFPRGLLVAQDGFNYDQDQLVPQNFKLVDWRTIEALLQNPKPKTH
jgi:3-phytase